MEPRSGYLSRPQGIGVQVVSYFDCFSVAPQRALRLLGESPSRDSFTAETQSTLRAAARPLAATKMSNAPRPSSGMMCLRNTSSGGKPWSVL